jgi:dihydrofolate reductase
VISIIVAHDDRRVIGCDGALPWHLPSDLRRFREVTTGHAVVMGRKTYESLPDAFRPLPGRRNVVLSSDPAYRSAGAEVFGDLEAALDACGRDCFVIGGALTYEQAIRHAERMYVTLVEGDHAGDAFFPELPAEAWRCVEASEPLTENDHRFSFLTYERAAA